jgi:uncharacterized membrane protein required for colicin V production
MYLRLITGELFNSSWARATEIRDYYNSIGKFYQNYVYYSNIATLGATFIGWVILSICQWIYIGRMSNFWIKL